jgi:hypothetical protein
MYGEWLTLALICDGSTYTQTLIQNWPLISSAF